MENSKKKMILVSNEPRNLVNDNFGFKFVLNKVTKRVATLSTAYRGYPTIKLEFTK